MRFCLLVIFCGFCERIKSKLGGIQNSDWRINAELSTSELVPQYLQQISLLCCLHLSNVRCFDYVYLRHWQS